MATLIQKLNDQKKKMFSELKKKTDDIEKSSKKKIFDLKKSSKKKIKEIEARIENFKKKPASKKAASKKKAKK